MNLEIEIRNWEKYNPKRAQRTYTWLRLDIDIARSPEFFGLSNEEKFVAIMVLCEAGKNGRGRFVLPVEWFCAEVAKVTPAFLKTLLSKLSAPNSRGESFIIIHQDTLGIDAPSLQHTTPGLHFTTPTDVRTDVRTDGRTDVVLRTEENKFTPNRSMFMPEVLTENLDPCIIQQGLRSALQILGQEPA
jgi:hypothetical protein